MYKMPIVTENLLGGCEKLAFLGNGTLALSLILRESGIKNRAVAVPVNVCPNVVQAVLYSGNYPHYIDIDPENMGMSAVELKREISAVAAVIAVHAYGTVCDIKLLAELCEKSRKLLIEDCAQALGAHLNGKPVGDFGDAAVFSFGVGKIVDLKRGAAVTSNDISLISKLNSYNSELPELSTEQELGASDFSALHTFFYNEFYPSRENQYAELLGQAAQAAKEAYCYRAPIGLDAEVKNSLDYLDQNLSQRQNRAEKFRELFRKEGLNFHWPQQGGVFWRFNLLVGEGRNKLLLLLLEEGFKVSSWYPRIDRFMGIQNERNDFTIAEKIGSSILNLWVNDEVDDFYTKKISDRILEFSRCGC
jgi:perosamine synthetase